MPTSLQDQPLSRTWHEHLTTAHATLAAPTPTPTPTAQEQRLAQMLLDVWGWVEARGFITAPPVPLPLALHPSINLSNPHYVRQTVAFTRMLYTVAHERWHAVAPEGGELDDEYTLVAFDVAAHYARMLLDSVAFQSTMLAMYTPDAEFATPPD